MVEFQNEAESYSSVRNALNLTAEGLLAYLGNRLVQDASDIRVSVTEPAIASYRDEL